MSDFLYNVPLFLSLLALIMGTLLIVVEVFLPGISVPGITGAILAIFGLAALSTHIGWYTVFVVMAMVAIILGALFYMSRSMQKGKRNPLILESYINEKSESSFELAGLSGVTVTPLRPSGIANINGENRDVVTAGEFIEKDRPITVVKVLGSRIIVRQAKTPIDG